MRGLDASAGHLHSCRDGYDLSLLDMERRMSLSSSMSARETGNSAAWWPPWLPNDGWS